MFGVGMREVPFKEMSATDRSSTIITMMLADTKFTNTGKIVMNFADETLRNEAAQKN